MSTLKSRGLNVFRNVDLVDPFDVQNVPLMIRTEKRPVLKLVSYLFPSGPLNLSIILMSNFVRTEIALKKGGTTSSGDSIPKDCKWSGNYLVSAFASCTGTIENIFCCQH